MRTLLSIITLILISLTTANAQETLLQARRGHKTKLLSKVGGGEPLADPPEALFSLVSYRSELGDMGAYLSRPAAAGRKYPAIIWITGGFPAGGIGESAWDEVSSDNDQSAKVYRLSDLVIMYPTLRGSFANPGHQEGFYGEVQDVVAALEYLRKVDYVDPERIYLGGHSTGGTLALLVAEATPNFRAVFSFGPVADPADYGQDQLTYDVDNPLENMLRAPIHFLGAIASPTFVIEGSEGNLDSLEELRVANSNHKLQFFPVKGASHFDVLAPVNRLLAKKIASLKGDAALELTAREVQSAFNDQQTAVREASDLETLARIRRSGVDLRALSLTNHYFASRERDGLAALARDPRAKAFELGEVELREDRNGQPYFLVVVGKRITLHDLASVFSSSRFFARLADKHEVIYDGWDVD